MYRHISDRRGRDCDILFCVLTGKKPGEVTYVGPSMLQVDSPDTRTDDHCRACN